MRILHVEDDNTFRSGPKIHAWAQAGGNTAALLTQRNLDEAAKAVGMSQRTLMRWLKLPEFQAAYREARRAAYSQAVAKLQQGAISTC
jgi:hypothetical protein